MKKMHINKQVNNATNDSAKHQNFFASLAIIVLACILGACEDHAGTTSTTSQLESGEMTQESTQILSTPPAQAHNLTIQLIEKKGAKRLNTNEILALIVDHSIVFEHLGTGEYFEAIYKNDGSRLLTNIDSGSLDDKTLHDAYVVKDDKLQTEFKGKPISSAIYMLNQRYLAAVDSDNGVVNYEIRDIVNAPLTVAVLKSQNAKMLSSEEIKQLFVGKKMLIKDLLTGDTYIGFYDDKGTRTLEYINPLTTPGSDNEMKISDTYKIHDNQLHSLLDGNEIASTIFQVGSFYYGALSVDDGAVNFEFIPQ